MTLQISGPCCDSDIKPGQCKSLARGGHLGIFWVGMCRLGLHIGTPFYKQFPLKLIPRSRIRPKTDTPF